MAEALSAETFARCYERQLREAAAYIVTGQAEHQKLYQQAKEQLFRLGLVHEHERAGVSKVLDAAALTYVAALVSSILTLLYYITLARDSRR